MKDDRKKVPLHPFDVWPPPQKDKEQKAHEEMEEKKPKNTSYLDPSLEEHAGNEPVYDVEEEKDRERIEQEAEKEERSDKS